MAGLWLLPSSVILYLMVRLYKLSHLSESDYLQYIMLYKVIFHISPKVGYKANISRAAWRSSAVGTLWSWSDYSADVLITVMVLSLQAAALKTYICRSAE